MRGRPCVAALSGACGVLLAWGGCAFSRSGTNASAAHTLHFALVAEPRSLDPAKTPDLVTYELLSHIFEPLVRYDENNRPQPCLADKWQISPDGKTYTFHLRPGVRFHDGHPLTAEDVKYSWERALAPGTASNVAPNYLDGILGEKDVVAGKSTDLTGVRLVDPLTLTVTLDRPRTYVLGMLSYPTGFVVCKEDVENHGGVVDEHDLIGTGPFTLDAYSAGRTIRLKANPGYWGGRPPLDAIEDTLMIDPQTVYDNFRTGAIDMWTSQLPFSRYAQDKAAGRFLDSYQVRPLAQVDYLAMNPARQPEFADARVRGAIALAVDRQEIVRVAYQGVCPLADGFLPRDLPGAGPAPPQTPYDPAAARALLAKAGYPGGKGFPTLNLITLEQTPPWQAACEIVRRNLHDNLGISVELQVREAGQYWEDEAKRALGFWLTAWVADYPDPQDFLSTLFVSGAPLNRVDYSDPGFDALCRQADAEPNADRRASLYGAANKLLNQDAPVIPLVYEPRLMLIRPTIKNWQTNLCAMLPDLHTVKEPR